MIEQDPFVDNQVCTLVSVSTSLKWAGLSHNVVAWGTVPGREQVLGPQ